MTWAGLHRNATARSSQVALATPTHTRGANPRRSRRPAQSYLLGLPLTVLPMPHPRIRYNRPEAFHPRQVPMMLETVAGALQRPIPARHMQPAELGLWLQERAT